MKTVMQELIYEMDLIKNQLWEEGLKDKSAMISDMIKKAVNKLEKEKEQIVAAREDGNMFYLFKSNEQYLKQTYNN
jgi:uncharacterized protein YtpQ (UPF0354 family)